MSTSSIHNKTIRPGSLNGYSYYYSGRRPAATYKPAKPARRLRLRFHKGLLILLIPAALIGLPLLRSDNTLPPASNKTASSVQPVVPAASAAPIPAPATDNHCANNNDTKLVKISISQRHLWACEHGKTVYDASVITGLQGHAETETPIGSYHIYAKQKDTTLKGTDSRGSWSDPVSYWMPFLDNQYGTYGFHDATWRPETDFGNVGPDSSDASHGCVELPLASSKWLYDWAPVHTPVIVES